MKKQDVAHQSNRVGGVLTLASVLFSWLIVSQDQGVSVFCCPFDVVAVVPWFVIAGGALSFASRYGGVVTTVGIATYGTFPPAPHFLHSLIPYNFGPGFWLAWAGAMISLLGSSSNFRTLTARLPMPLRVAIPPFGTLLVVFGGLALYSELIVPVPAGLLTASIAIMFTGFLVTLVGLTHGSVLVDRHPHLGG